MVWRYAILGFFAYPPIRYIPEISPTTSPDSWPLMYFFTSCCSCPLCTSSLGSELVVAVPPAHKRFPVIPTRSLGKGQALATGRLGSPSQSAEVIHPRVWTGRG